MSEGAPRSGDRAAVADLLAAYGVLLDREALDEWLALFTEDAAFEAFGRTFSGHEGLRKMATSRRRVTFRSATGAGDRP